MREQSCFKTIILPLIVAIVFFFTSGCNVNPTSSPQSSDSGGDAEERIQEGVAEEPGEESMDESIDDEPETRPEAGVGSDDRSEAGSGSDVDAESAVNDAENSESNTSTFETVAQGDSLVAKLDTPTIMVIRTKEDVSSVESLFDDASVSSQLSRVDFNQKIAIVAFGGQFGSSGYGININNVQIEPGKGIVIVDQSEPDPDRMSAAVISYPYHIVLFPKGNMGQQDSMVWQMVDSSNSILAESIYP